MQHIFRYSALFFLLVVSLFGVEKLKLLTSEEAFKVAATHNVQGVIISVVLGEGIYLYDDKITLELVKPSLLSFLYRKVYWKMRLKKAALHLSFPIRVVQNWVFAISLKVKSLPIS